MNQDLQEESAMPGSLQTLSGSSTTAVPLAEENRPTEERLEQQFEERIAKASTSQLNDMLRNVSALEIQDDIGDQIDKVEIDSQERIEDEAEMASDEDEQHGNMDNVSNVSQGSETDDEQVEETIDSQVLDENFKALTEEFVSDLTTYELQQMLNLNLKENRMLRIQNAVFKQFLERNDPRYEKDSYQTKLDKFQKRFDATKKSYAENQKSHSKYKRLLDVQRVCYQASSSPLSSSSSLPTSEPESSASFSRNPRLSFFASYQK
ncbi:unnamed protein product [Nesidiocoris tenuis]|uniref:Uncharacterized protein n=1 Tax=Nesidiocoris tenuis TaxID=355587 RepID=A0A6H5GZP5_9HEMI|nr:unnamed protein product [Nesidiocoris tenuis]